MKESYGEGLATHTGPESCVSVRKGEGEALTGVRTGRVLSREIHAPLRKQWALRGADAVEISGRPHLRRRFGKTLRDPARSQTPSMYGNTLRGNREIPRSSAASTSRPHREVQGRTPMMNGRGKSDSSVVPEKPPNKARATAAEAVEGRGLAKGNSPERNAFRTQSRGDAPSALERVREAARRDRQQRFTALLHHVYDVERLRAAYRAIKRDAAAGVDGESWQHYGETLGGEPAATSPSGSSGGAYRAKPVRRAYIAEDGRAAAAARGTRAGR